MGRSYSQSLDDEQRERPNENKDRPGLCFNYFFVFPIRVGEEKKKKEKKRGAGSNQIKWGGPLANVR